MRDEVTGIVYSTVEKEKFDWLDFTDEERDLVRKKCRFTGTQIFRQLPISISAREMVKGVSEILAQLPMDEAESFCDELAIDMRRHVASGHGRNQTIDVSKNRRLNTSEASDNGS